MGGREREREDRVTVHNHALHGLFVRGLILPPQDLADSLLCYYNYDDFVSSGETRKDHRNQAEISGREKMTKF